MDERTGEREGGRDKESKDRLSFSKTPGHHILMWVMSQSGDKQTTHRHMRACTHTVYSKSICNRRPVSLNLYSVLFIYEKKS